MKHLTILSVSAAILLMTGAHFQSNHINSIATSQRTGKIISIQVKEGNMQSDSLVYSAGNNITTKAVQKVEHGSMNLIGKIVKSLY